jgi:hypothetical protein
MALASPLADTTYRIDFTVGGLLEPERVWQTILPSDHIGYTHIEPSPLRPDSMWWSVTAQDRPAVTAGHLDFERTAGRWRQFKGEGTSKSGELAQALSGAKKIVVCTIQTFPFALMTVQELAAGAPASASALS